MKILTTISARGYSSKTFPNTMKLRIIRVDLPLRHVFGTSQRSVSVVRTIIVELEQDGLRGYGEAYEDPFYNVSVESMVDAIETVRDQIERYALADPVALWRQLDPYLENNRFAQSALDIAAYDLWGKMRNRSLWKIWGYNLKNLPVSSYSIGNDSIERMIELFQEVPDWPVYKIRLGLRNDLEILREFRKLTDAPFRIDVNGGWNLETATRIIPVLEDLNVEFIEQPLPADDWLGMDTLKEISPIPLIADESLGDIDSLDRVAEYFDGVHLKFVKDGGITPTRQVLGKAKHLGLKTVMGGMVESAIGTSAIAQMAPQLDYLDLSGPFLIEKKVGSGLRLEQGRLIYPDEFGTGVRYSSR